MEERIKTGAVTIRKIMYDKNVSTKQLAEEMTKLGLAISQEVLSNKITRDTFSLNEYIMIANILECDVKTISRNGTVYDNECDIETLKKKKENQKKPKKEETKEAEQ